MNKILMVYIYSPIYRHYITLYVNDYFQQHHSFIWSNSTVRQEKISYVSQNTFNTLRASFKNAE